MSFFVSRAVTGGQDRADIFARGDVAVLAVADGAGGLGDGNAAADLAMTRIREAVLDPGFDLLHPLAWARAFEALDRDVGKVGETTAIIVGLSPGMTIACSAGDSEAWLARTDDVVKLVKRTPRLGSGRVAPDCVVRGELDGRLVVGSDGLFRHVASDKLVAHLRTAPWAGLADSLVELARLPSGEFADDVAVLVAER